jgi:Ca2+-transporting ATPase
VKRTENTGNSVWYFHSQTYRWIEGFAIIVAVLIVSTVSSVNDWSKDRKFRQLNKANDEIDIKVLRNGETTTVSISKLVVGDVVVIDTGDAVSADGLCTESFDIRVDESVMTGETDKIKKDPIHAPFFLSGTKVEAGCGKMLVIAVGENSEWGKTLKKMNEDDDDDETPLEQKLDRLAGLIGKVGVGFAVTTVIVLIVVWLIKKIIFTVRGEDHFAWGNLGEVVKFIVIGVTIVVVAVPEGLPLAVTISLAYSVSKMMKDNNLVRHLSACETMGGATNICSDKTGTLTLNQMRVVKAWIAGESYMEKMPTQDSFSAPVNHVLSVGIAVNSKASLVEHADKAKGFDVLGNKTEGALLIMLNKDLEGNYATIRQKYEDRKAIEKLYTFSSEKKRMSAIVRNEDDTRTLYTKGASEIILALCTSYINKDGKVSSMSNELRKELETVIEDMANQGLRTICMAYRPVNESPDLWDDQDAMETNLICIGLVGIKDPVRPEVPDAVKQCKKSGIFVRMVTGDNIRTAKFIARECGILDEDGLAMEGPDFRKLSEEELDEKLPYLQVLARSSPTDKYILVKRLRHLNEVVAVTGDGTNDAPALKEADVGMAMGLSGTQVAKQAADIIIMDDNFNSIVKSVLWGRSVFENIRKFLQFQLTVNVVALLLTVITAFTSFLPPSLFIPQSEQSSKTHLEPPLTAVQLLWVNLIMDTFAALALATEPPLPSLLDRKPYGRFESLITPSMWANVVGQGIYQLLVLLVLYYAGVPLGLSPGAPGIDKFDQNNTMVFNAFVFCQVFNEFNSRKINNEFNIFQNLHKSYMFIFVIIITCVMQALIVLFGGRFTQTVPITWYQWLISIGLGALGIPFSLFIRVGFYHDEEHGE